MVGNSLIVIYDEYLGIVVVFVLVLVVILFILLLVFFLNIVNINLSGSEKSSNVVSDVIYI